MIITTCLRPDINLVKEAEIIASDLNGQAIIRNELSLEEIYHKFNKPILVLGKNRLEWYEDDQAIPYFFHPNSSVFRIRRLMKGEHDPFCDACLLTKGDSLLDCTLGMASDSIVASYVVGDQGKILGLEKNQIIAYLTSKGLKTNKQNINDWSNIINKIEVKNIDYKNYLKSLPDHSFDIVYFDPMFEKNIEASSGIAALKNLASYDDLNYEVINEARRVAKKRVVLKDHFRSERYKKYGFNQLIRKSSEFHFGFIEVRKEEY
ncbi:class I SAM-dependent methyltransferase [Bacillus sp. AFS017336]|uniref:class I SAM-dependent methyltransferase n=1 Tax=Bacillus sp. AFS017336 TaxID=2033489 RepID=UPI000BF0829B|nr:class I SAM-dependent methyltransferase [Bacillus sp. AFS017336]PEK99880.1 protein-L-IsoD(D-D) O-methyltransferase [Bacillus sp. AFS017336]